MGLFLGLGERENSMSVTKLAYLVGVLAFAVVTQSAEAQRTRSNTIQNTEEAPVFRIQMAEPGLLKKGRRYLQRNKPALALKAYQELIATENSEKYLASAYNGSCAAYISLGQYVEALDACDNAVDLNNRRWRIHNNRGTALFHLGRLRDAIKAFERGRELSPKTKMLKTNLQIAQQRLATLTGGSVNSDQKEGLVR